MEPEAATQDLDSLYAAVDEFAAAMKERLAQKAAAGYTGWDDAVIEASLITRIRRKVQTPLLEEPEITSVDAANLLMMYWRFNRES